jgi:hypothetical protein
MSRHMRGLEEEKKNLLVMMILFVDYCISEKTKKKPSWSWQSILLTIASMFFAIGLPLIYSSLWPLTGSTFFLSTPIIDLFLWPLISNSLWFELFDGLNLLNMCEFCYDQQFLLTHVLLITHILRNVRLTTCFLAHDASYSFGGHYCCPAPTAPPFFRPYPSTYFGLST